jgi:hypothetical protein
MEWLFKRYDAFHLADRWRPSWWIKICSEGVRRGGGGLVEAMSGDQ